MGKRPGVLLYFDRVVFLDRLTDEQNGKIFSAVIRYARDGEEPKFDEPVLWMAWDFLRPALDEDAARYEAICEKRKASIQKRWEAERTNEYKCIPNTTPKTKSNTNTASYQPHGAVRDDLALAERLLGVTGDLKT